MEQKEATISGPPRIVEWGDLGPVLEVPLSTPPDWVWIEALHRTPHKTSHVVRWDAEEGRLLVESSTENLVETYEWLIEHVDQVAEEAKTMRAKVWSLQAELGQWWVDR